MYKEIKKDGSVKYLMPYKDVLTGKTKRVSVIMDKDTPRNRRRAEEHLQLKIDELTCLSSPDRITFEKAIDDYVDFKSRTIKASTVRRNKATLGRILKCFPKGTLLNSITAIMWKNELIALSDDNNGTYNEYLTRLKSFLRWCYSSDYLTDSTFIDKLVPLPAPSKHEKVAEKFLEEEEVPVILNAMHVEHWRLLAEFMILSGMRVGEIIALEKSDIDDDVIHVTKTYDIIEEKATSPKTLESVRDIYIQEELADLIGRVKKHYMRQSKYYNMSSPLLFFDVSDAGHVKYWAFNKYLKETCLKAIDKHVTTHTLRHTSASLLMAAGVPIDVISRRLGHIDSKVTKEIYLHITEKLKKKDAEKLQKVKLISTL